jgi:hypothetical protein
MPVMVSGSFSRKDLMRTQDNSELVGYSIAAIVAAVLIYNFWHWLVGALAIFGFWFVVKEYNRNNRPPR